MRSWQLAKTLALIISLFFFLPKTSYSQPSNLEQIASNRESDQEILQYIERMTANLGEDAAAAARDPETSFAQLNDQFGLAAVLAAVSYRSAHSEGNTGLSSRLDLALQELGLPIRGDSAPPEADHLLPLEASYQAFEAGVKLGRRPYLPEASFETIAEALQYAEGHRPEIANAMAHNALSLFSRLLEYGREAETNLGEDEFELQLEQNLLNVRIRGKGRAELNTVDGVKWQNLRLDGSDLAFIWENANQVHPQSKHSQRIIASQHLVGGKGRADQQRGRDVLKVRYYWDNAGNLKIESINYFPRHRFLSKAWIKDFALYDGTRPSKADVFVLGIPAGLWQAGVTAGFDLVNKGEVNWSIAAFTFFFGGIYCGIFSTNIRRITNEFSRTDTGRLIANIIMTSLPYALLYKALYSREGLSALDPSSLSGLLLYVGLSVHFVMNNVTKVEFQGVFSDRTAARLNTSRFLGVRRSNLEQTLNYNAISFPARIADLSNFMRVEISRAMQLSTSGGRIWLIGLYPFARWIKVLNREWIEESRQAQGQPLQLGARRTREQWSRSLMGFFIGLPIGTLADALLAAWSYALPFRPRDQIPRGSFTDVFRFFAHYLRPLDDPMDHIRRIGQRWEAHSEMPGYQARRFGSGMRRAGTAVLNGGRSAIAKCGAGIRWLGTGLHSGDYYPPY